ncbi:MAG: VOC family protein [Candidatus Kerfeldbacteria bacterium]|nr:VOC family protein [Candidatus Kerfeldbacteria bacterium]
MIPHIAIPVTQIDRSIQFYQRLGFVLGKKWERPDWQMSGCFLTHPSGLHVELILHPGNADIHYPTTPEVLHLAIPVSDLEMMMTELIQTGVPVIRPIAPGITVKRLAFIRDPDGLAIELFEPHA